MQIFSNATDLNGATSEEVEKANEFFADLETAEKRKSRWAEARTGGVPSEIKLQETELAEATCALEELEARQRRLRGDVFPPAPLSPPILPQPIATYQTIAVSSAVQASAQSMSLGHSTKERRTDILSPAIKIAQSRAGDPHDINEVWAQLQAMADAEHLPLLASTKDGVKYNRDGITRYFKRDALKKRLSPERRGQPAKRR